MPDVPAYSTLGGRPLQQAQYYPAARCLANSYRCPIGFDPGIAYVVMLRSDFSKLDTTGPLPLVISSGSTVKIPKLYLRRAIQITQYESETGAAGDPNAALLLKLYDCRFLFGQFSAINSQYNVRMPAPPYDGNDRTLYYSESLNGSDLWTWQTMIGDIWGNLPGAGSAPTLPATPTGTPDGLRFIGVSAWEALRAVCDRLCLVLAYDPIADSFALQQQGATQAGVSDAEAKYTSYEADLGVATTPATQIPTTVRVFFHRTYPQAGSEPTTGRTGNFAQNAVYSVDVATGVSGASSGVAAIWDDLTAITAFDGTVANGSDLTARANEHAAAWVARKTAVGTRRRYTGALPEFLPGSTNKSILWRDYGPGDEWGLGACTEVDKFPPGWDMPRAGGVAGALEGLAERIGSPDLGRATTPNYPPLLQIVKVNGSGSTGDPQSANSGGFIDGLVQRIDATQSASSGAIYNTAEACWLLVTNPVGASPTLKKGNRYLGRLSGYVSYSGGTARPLYILDLDAATPIPVYRFRTDASLNIPAAGGTGTVSGYLQVWDSGTSAYLDGAAVTLVDFYAQIGTPDPTFSPGAFQALDHYYGFCIKLPDKDEYQILYMEQQALFAEVTLTADMSSGSATCTFDKFWHGIDVGDQTSCYDTMNWWPTAKSGDKGRVCWDEKRLKYVVTAMKPGSGGDNLIPFYITYTGSLERGGFATGNTLKWDAGSAMYVDDSIGVLFFDSQYLGPMRYKGDNDRAQQGWSRYNSTLDVFEVVSCSHLARRMEFTVIVPMAKTEEGAYVQATLLYDGVPQHTVPYTMFVSNSRRLFEMAVGKKGEAVYKPELDIWEIDWVECSGKTVTPTYPAAPPTDDSYSGGSSAPAQYPTDLPSQESLWNDFGGSLTGNGGGF